MNPVPRLCLQTTAQVPRAERAGGGVGGRQRGPETHSPCFLKIPFLFQIYSKMCIFQDEHTCMAACWKVICNSQNKSKETASTR